MNWKELWMTLFGTCEWLGLNMGFWVSMAAVLLIVILMNVVFWGIKPKNKKSMVENKLYPIAILLISANSRCVEPPFAIIRTYCF